jgi:hypothetical protein
MLTEYISIVRSQSVTFIVITLWAKYANAYFGLNLALSCPKKHELKISEAKPLLAYK